MTLYTENDLRDALRAAPDDRPVPSPETLIAAVRARGRRQRRLAAAATVAVVAAAGLSLGLTLSSAGGVRPGLGTVQGTLPAAVGRELHRPLDLPRVAPGGTCPVTPGTDYNGPVVGGDRYGESPAWLVIGDRGDPPRGIAQLGIPDRKGWLAAENVLLVDSSYQGPVTVRARRLDGSGLVSLGGNPGSSTYVLPVAGQPAAPMTIWTKTPGCYGFQIDGQTFSETIVIHFTPPAPTG